MLEIGARRVGGLRRQLSISCRKLEPDAALATAGWGGRAAC